MNNITININTVHNLNLSTLKDDLKAVEDLEVIVHNGEIGKGDKPKMGIERDVPAHVYRGEIWLAELTDTKYVKHGEQGGFRPVLVVQNNIGNRYSPTVIGLCITSKNKREVPTHVTIPRSSKDEVDSIVLCEQITTISKERLNRRIGMVSSEIMDEVNRKMLFSLALDGQTR